MVSSSWAYVIGKTCRYNCTQIHELDNVFLMPRFGLDAGIAYEVHPGQEMPYVLFEGYLGTPIICAPIPPSQAVGTPAQPRQT